MQFNIHGFKSCQTAGYIDDWTDRYIWIGLKLDVKIAERLSKFQYLYAIVSSSSRNFANLLRGENSIC